MISSAIIPQPLARLPWRLIWLVALICTIGVVTLYSAAGGSASRRNATSHVCPASRSKPRSYRCCR